MSIKAKKIVEKIGMILVIIIFVSFQIYYITTYFNEGDKEMMNLRYQQQTYLSSLIIVFSLFDIILLIGGFYYLKNKIFQKLK